MCARRATSGALSECSQAATLGQHRSDLRARSAARGPPLPYDAPMRETNVGIGVDRRGPWAGACRLHDKPPNQEVFEGGSTFNASNSRRESRADSSFDASSKRV